MKSITTKDLECVVERLNIITKSPLTSWTRNKNGEFKANIGNYHLDWAYGGVQLQRMQSEGGGVDAITPGHCTKRELYIQMQAYISGLLEGSSK